MSNAILSVQTSDASYDHYNVQCYQAEESPLVI